MAEQNLVKSYVAAGAITEFAFVKIDTAGKVVVATTADDARVVGVAQRAASTGDIVEVVVHGLTRVIAGEAIDFTASAILPIECGALGKAFANDTAGGYGLGYILPSSQNLVLADGEQVEIIFNGPKTPLPTP
jgi:hypothetical protein